MIIVTICNILRIWNPVSKAFITWAMHLKMFKSDNLISCLWLAETSRGRLLLINPCTWHSDCFSTHAEKAPLLTHWGRVTHICISRLTITGSDNGLAPGRRQAIIWTNAGILVIGPFGTNFSENLIEILTFSFTKMLLKASSAKWRPFCLGLNVLTYVAQCCHPCTFLGFFVLVHRIPHQSILNC